MSPSPPARPFTLFALLLLAAAALARPASSQLVVAGNHRVFQDDAGGAIEAGDHFGAALAAGDFDRDGFWDLAIGVPDEDVGAIADAGAVYVVYGEPEGPGQGTRLPLVLHQDIPLVQDVSEPGDRFGAALAVGDFNDDGFDDLAVGVPGEDLPFVNAGALHVFPGAPGGLVAAADTFVYGDLLSPATYEAAADEDLASALATCDRNGDGYDDLLVGVPGHDRISGADTGLVLTLHGGASGVETAGAHYFAPSEAEGGDRFGSSIACGHLDAGASGDLVVGAPFAEIGSGGPDSGATFIHTGSGSVVILSGDLDGARMGVAVAAGRVGPTGSDSAVASLPGFDTDGQAEAGLVRFWDGVNPPLLAVAQGLNGVGETTEPFDQFGEALAVGDFDRDGWDDLVVGVPGENLDDGPGVKLDAGLVHVIPGSPLGPSGTADQLWTWDDPILFGAYANDHFGAALAVGDFDANGVDDLAIGAPTAVWSAQSGTGIVQILYGVPPGWIFGDGFETGDTRKWGP